MPENLFCPGMTVPSKEYLEHYEEIEWGKPSDPDSLFIYHFVKGWKTEKKGENDDIQSSK